MDSSTGNSGGKTVDCSGTTLDAFMDALPVKGAMKDRVIRIENGQTLDFDEMPESVDGEWL